MEIASTVYWRDILDLFANEPDASNLNWATFMLHHCFEHLHRSIGDNSDFLHSNQLQIFTRIWNQVDGGVNQFVDLQQKCEEQSVELCLKNPDRITGDFDSINTDLLDRFKGLQEVEIIETPDQDATDFTKAMNLLAEKDFAERPLNAVIVFGSNSGRIDQFLSVLSTMYDFTVNQPDFPPIILVDLGDSISFVLKQNSHIIPVLPDAKWCSLIPLDGSAMISTAGFRWNLSEEVLQFGKLISTSNEFSSESELAYVKCFNKPILFSVDYK